MHRLGPTGQYVSHAALYVPAGAGGGGQVSTWDPSAAGTLITLSNGNLDAISALNSWSSVRGTVGKTTGKKYFELLIVINAADELAGCIMDNTTAGGVGLDAFCPANIAGTRNDGLDFNTGFTDNGSAGLGTTATNGVIGVAVDVDNKKMWMAYDNTWIGSGDPGAGTNHRFGWSATYTIFPAVQLYHTTAKLRLVTAGTTYTPPSGFSTWD